MCRWCYTCDSTFCCFFYFQAEDGIRDLYVTGVQTCALPISQLRGGGIGGIEGVTPFCPPSTPPWAVQSRRWHSRDRVRTAFRRSAAARTVREVPTPRRRGCCRWPSIM